MSEHEFRPEFDLGAFRFAVAKYVKLLIRARWKDDPGFLSHQALTDWGLLKINDDSILDNRIPSWCLLEEAAEALGLLNTEFIPRCPSGGLTVVTEDTPEGRLIDEIAFLANTEGGGPYHNQALVTAARSIQANHKVDWASLVDWSKLPSLRQDLNRLPHPRRGNDDRARRNVFRWNDESKRWDIVFQGKAILVPDRVGVFYLGELLARPGKLIPCSELREAYASWRADPASHLRRQAENAALVRRKKRDDDGDTNEALGSPVQDLGDELDKKARAKYRARIAALPAEIELLRSRGSTALAEEAVRELAELEKTLRASLNHLGLPRKSSEVHRKDQDAVCTAIRRTLKEIRTVEPPLHDHLRPSLELGWKCCYLPQPVVIWNR